MLSSTPPSRSRRRRSLIAAAAVASALAATAVVVQPTAQGAQGAPQRPAVKQLPSATHRVTLITGDVVTVTTLADGRQIADVDRPDSAVGGVRLHEIDGDIVVVPDEAFGLLGANKLDRRLFNVTDLIEMGYDDAHLGRVPTIATFTAAATRRDATPDAPTGSKMVRRLSTIRGAALVVGKKQARTFWSSVAPSAGLADPTPTLGAGVAKLWLDGKVEATLKESVPQIGAPEAWAAGYDGTGVTVAVLDTGIDVNHPDFAGQIDGTQSFVPGEGITDINGHGTHVASTIVGTGAASGGDYKGVAPGADLIVGKVLGGPEGSGQDSWVLAGMEWAAQSGADVVSMSLGDSMPSDGTDPMSQAVNNLSEQYGTLFVIAAGNAGPESISTPGAAASALTVGAVDKQDGLAYFSSTGPLTVSGALKPDLVAPGVDITAARSQEMTDGGEGLYRTISGTSMATPHVSGAAAILAQRHPNWTGQQLKEQLMSSTAGLADWYSPYEVGTGRVDVAAAITNPVSGTPTLFFGNYDWPHEPTDVAVTKDLTFTNHGDTDVTLDLALTGTAFILGADTVTVPAGGTATVGVTGDPQAVDFGRHTGYVIGTDAATGTPLTRTSLGLLKEDERYNLNIKLIDRNSAPASSWVGIQMAGDFWPWAVYVDGETTMRMPKGTYSVVTYLDVNGEKADRSGLATLVDPETVLDHSADVVLDASKARLLQTQAPQRAQDRQRKVDFSIIDKFGLESRSAYAVPPMYDDLYVSPTEAMTEGSFMLTTRWRKGEPMLGLSVPGGKLTFETLVQPGSAFDTATNTLATAYAGNGSAADYQGVKAKGRIVVVRRSDAVAPDERVAAATQAGAAALIVVNDGVGGLNEWVGGSTILVATVHRDAGQKLISLARQGRRLTAKQVEFTPWVYDLAREYPDQVPDRPLVYRPTQDQLAKIDAQYYGTRDGLASGYRYDMSLIPTLGAHEREWHPGTRVEWVTPDQVWAESHAQNIYGELPWELVSGFNTFAAKSTTRLEWFRPAIAPGNSDSFAVQTSRWGDYMTWNVQAWSAQSDVMQLGGYLPWGATPMRTQVFQGDTLIHDNPWSADMQWKEVPAGDLPYRVVLDAERPADVFRLSTRTHTEWEFRSDTVTGSDYFEPFPVMQLEYRLPTDLHGDISAGSRQQIALRPTSSNSQALPGHFTQVTLDLSYDDGASWQKVTLTKGADGWWRATLNVPNKAGAFLSVRASAGMDSGYAIRQEIIRAYGVR